MLVNEFITEEYVKGVTKRIAGKASAALLAVARKMGEASFELESINLPGGNLRTIAGKFDRLGRLSQESFAKVDLEALSPDMKGKVKKILLSEIESLTTNILKR